MGNRLLQQFRRNRPSIGILLALAVASAELAPAQVAVAAAVVNEDRYPARKIEFPGGVTGLPDLVYSHPAGFRGVMLDLYLPPGAPAAGARPFVVYIHGGGWSGGMARTTSAFENWPGVLASLAAKGYVVVSLNYRLSGEAPFPAAEQDVKAAVRWLRTNAAMYGVDPQRGLVWGVSAGGHLAALAATSCGVAALEPAAAGRGRRPVTDKAEESDCVQGLVSWYGIFDFQPLVGQAGASGDTGVGRFLGCTKSGCPEGAIHLASPVSYVDAHTPPTLLIHGTADKTVNPKQSQDMYELLKSKGIPVEIMMIPGVAHSFIGETPDATRTACNAALARTFAFIDATIGRKTKSGAAR
jgi:acetyl esterase/lipase